MELSGIRFMKMMVLVIFLSAVMNCYSQTTKDTTSKTDSRQMLNKNQNFEKKEEIKIITDRNVNTGKLYKIISEAEYYQDFKKPLLKDIFEQNIKTDKDLISENMQGILSDVRRANEDKRSFLLKTIQSALGIAQTAVVTALAIREIVREVEKKPKK